jgi:uncharacterized protein with von Willebrand factor type A (vWA) domain
LKNWGVPVTLSRTIDAFRGLEKINILESQDFYWTLAVCLVAKKSDLEIFDAVFNHYFGGTETKEQLYRSIQAVRNIHNKNQSHFNNKNVMHSDNTKLQSVLSVDMWLAEKTEPKYAETDESYVYSPLEAIIKKDIEEYSEQDLLMVTPMVRKLAKLLATKLSRRKEKGKSRRLLDFRSTIRKSIKYGGEIIRIARSKKRVNKAEIVFLCDISGSMLNYSRFSLIFLQAIARQSWGIEVFLFSTQLVRATYYLRKWEPGSVTAKVADKLPNWGSGTKIGGSLKKFLHDWGRSNLDSHSVVVIISDGWDVGDIELLSSSLMEIKKRAKILLWLNPLMGTPNFEPTCRGMQLAVKYSDKLLPFYNLDSVFKMNQEIINCYPVTN